MPFRTLEEIVKTVATELSNASDYGEQITEGSVEDLVDYTLGESEYAYDRDLTKEEREELVESLSWEVIRELEERGVNVEEDGNCYLCHEEGEWDPHGYFDSDDDE